MLFSKSWAKRNVFTFSKIIKQHSSCVVVWKHSVYNHQQQISWKRKKEKNQFDIQEISVDKQMSPSSEYFFPDNMCLLTTGIVFLQENESDTKLISFLFETLFIKSGRIHAWIN